MTCARCEGRLLKDLMYDLPRKIHEYTCFNCGERFWMEMETPASPPLEREGSPVKHRAQESAEDPSANKLSERGGLGWGGDLGLLAANN